MLKHKTEYVDLGAQYYEKKYKEQVEKNLKKRAEMLGYELVKKPVETTSCITVH